MFLIPSYLESTFNRKTFDLREKNALKVDPQKVDSLEVITAGGTLKFTKVNGAWQLTSPAEPRTDPAAVDVRAVGQEALSFRRLCAARTGRRSSRSRAR